MESKAFSKIHRRADFLRLVKKGVRVRFCDWATAFVLPRSDRQISIGWTFPRSVGNAVVRNRRRRQVREVVAQMAKSLGQAPGTGYDVNLVFSRGLGRGEHELGFLDVERAVMTLIHRAEKVAAGTKGRK